MQNNNDNFETYKQKRIDKNERLYGAEIRTKYGENVIDRSNARFKGMSKERHAEMERLTQELNDTLKAAFEQGDPASALAQKACELHKQWLCFFWDEGVYSRETHMGIAQMYVDDARFTAFYDKIAPGCAVFLRDAVRVYTAEKQ
jgi:N12 class adenine-specific DNA methylase